MAVYCTFLPTLLHVWAIRNLKVGTKLAQNSFSAGSLRDSFYLVGLTCPSAPLRMVYIVLVGGAVAFLHRWVWCWGSKQWRVLGGSGVGRLKPRPSSDTFTTQQTQWGVRAVYLSLCRSGGPSRSMHSRQGWTQWDKRSQGCSGAIPLSGRALTPSTAKSRPLLFGSSSVQRRKAHVGWAGGVVESQGFSRENLSSTPMPFPSCPMLPVQVTFITPSLSFSICKMG